MSDRVSDGLVAELERLCDDGISRGLAWTLGTSLLLNAIDAIETEEEVAMANEALAAAISSADDAAIAEMEMRDCIDQLKGYLEKAGDE